MSNATDETDRTPDGERSRHGGNSEDPGDTAAAARLDERLRAVERALTGTDAAVADLTDEATAASERAALASRVEDLESRVEELEAATQAIRGYVGSVRAVNAEVERRADLALARATRGAGTDEANGAATGDDEETPVDGLPGDDALDAAVPRSRRRRPGEEATTEVGEELTADRDGAGGSWRDGALERLRESL
ncbi:hypothetical protein U4E84_02775 [Halorubrum sp. AD140]|uniref:DUF7310 family coiled-coil domain-containing protein n=1 Tax=Halorubrum sp. AD140 TaxID=3050073 RepID=UPI002ACCBBF2|nr:hypothetical protein [Halorubrum sp. AD140]MDZ5810279.1 hypothetical protein [Halorubrum sp. AD140]